MKWIGQHIWNLISRFRTTVYLENLETSTETNILVVDSDGKVTKNANAGDDMSFTVEDGDTTDVVISDGKHWKFKEGYGININWTGDGSGTSSDEYNLTFDTMTILDHLDANGGLIKGSGGYDVHLESAQSIKFRIDYDEASSAGTHTFDFVNGAGSTVASIDEDGIPTFAIGGKGSSATAVIVDGGSGNLKSRTLAEFKGDASLGNVEDKSSATIRGEIVDSDIPNLNASKINAGTLGDAQIPSLNVSKITAGTFNSDRVKQICVTTHNFQLSNNTSIKNYVPFNNLNESTNGGPMTNYWTRTLAPYPGTIKKIAVRSQTSLGSSCELRISKITDTTDKLEDGTHVDNTSIDLSTAQTTVITTMNTNSFAAGDAIGVALQRSAGTSAQVILTIVWEYTT